MANVTCFDSLGTTSLGGVWRHNNPLFASVPLLLCQLTLISLVSKAVEILLKPLGQCSIVAQILGGLVLGPSVLGLAPKVASQLFPQRGTIFLETLATFGIAIFLFSIGVKMDSGLMFRPQRTALIISMSLFIFTLITPLIICFILMQNLVVDPEIWRGLPLIVGSQALVAFPAIACLLAELQIFNTEVGRLAMAVAMFYDMLAMITCAIGFTFLETQQDGFTKSIAVFMSVLLLVGGTVLIVKRLLLPLMGRGTTRTQPQNSMSPEEDSANEVHLTVIIVLVLLVTLASEIVGQHYFLGPVILGLAVPDASPLGAAVVSKLDTFVSGLLYPTYLAISGVKTDIFSVGIRHCSVTALIVLAGVLAKFAAVMLPATYCKVPFQEALVLGFVMNARGINELIMYNLVLEDKHLSGEDFTLLVISAVVVTAIVTPFIRHFYDPSRRYIQTRRMTIQHHKRDTEIRIVVCIHQQDDVPSIVNLLEATGASKESPVAVMAVILVEVVGTSAAMLLGYRPHRALETSTSKSCHTSNAFQQYERQNAGNASVNMFTNMSHVESMHDDIIRIAADKRAHFVILPFHKQWAIDGSVGAVKGSIQALNLKLIEWAPCSLGIFIDRGPLNGNVSILNSQSKYRVAVLFLGGPDDAESLAYGARMVRHERVHVIIIRFLLLGRDNPRERKQNSEIIGEYRHANSGNERFKYREELVKDGVGLAEAIKAMETSFDLIIVGRDHQNSPLLDGLHAWSECPELGVIGDSLASADATTTASILVVQQQKTAGKMNSSGILLQNDRDIHDDPADRGQRSTRSSSVSISVDSDTR